MKRDAIEPTPGNFTFATGGVTADLVKQNNQLLRYHNLVWRQQLPAWVTNTNWTKASLATALHKRGQPLQGTTALVQCRQWGVERQCHVQKLFFLQNIGVGLH
jgi:endo-1,4-beta-xylanase